MAQKKRWKRQSQQDHWEKKSLETQLIKINPGITQFERRLSGPFHQLMQAYTAAFPKYKGTTFKAHWQSLVLTDPEGAWLGRVTGIHSPFNLRVEM